MKRAKQTSFFYLLVALGCFDRARQARHCATLRNVGRNYLMKATKVTSAFEPRRSIAGTRAVSETA
jgi:hypothetical protein